MMQFCIHPAKIPGSKDSSLSINICENMNVIEATKTSSENVTDTVNMNVGENVTVSSEKMNVGENEPVDGTGIATQYLAWSGSLNDMTPN